MFCLLVMTCLADIVQSETILHRPFLRPVFATHFKIVRVVAGGTEDLSVQRIEWQANASLCLRFLHIFENCCGRADEMNPPLCLLGKGHTLRVWSNDVATPARIVEVVLHIEFHNELTRIVGLGNI